MKLHSIILAAAFALITYAASAVPAKPGSFRYTQPDGSIITLRLHGDEFFHWTTDASGQVVAQDADGFYRPATLDLAARAQARQRRQGMDRLRRSTGPRSTEDPLTHGERHIPVFLVEFQDEHFSIDNPQARFDALLNQKGYSANGGTGSVRDYYEDNSHGVFKPVFDVYRVIELSQSMAYYGEDKDGRPVPLAVSEAARALDDEVDFSQYDYDHDGYVDMCLMYFAGHNEAEGGGVSTIWPHQWWVNAIVHTEVDGLVLGRYFCTSELRGSWGTNMCGIGTTCHEFGHSLGLPDFYDTDYDDNGECGALYTYSLMCSGSYNNNGCTPPYFNAEERILLGWMSDTDVPELSAGTFSFESIQNDIAYKSLTDIDGEYFLYECRDGRGWDSPLSPGLVIYHVDKSTEYWVGGMTPAQQWEAWSYYNSINAYGDHPCFYIVPSYDPSALNLPFESEFLVFPGSTGNTSYTPLDWKSHATATSVKDISYNNGKVSLTAEIQSPHFTVSGKVNTFNGSPVAGAHISVLATIDYMGRSRARIQAHAATSENNFTTYTDENGYYSIDLEGFDHNKARITVSHEGYVTQSKVFTLSSFGNQVDFTLARAWNGEEEVWISYYDETADMYSFGYGGGYTQINAAICVSAQELAPFSSMEIRQFRFFLNCQAAASVHVVADAGGSRILCYEVPGEDLSFGEEGCTVDLKEQHIMVPRDKDLYIGVAIKGADTDYPILALSGGGNLYYGPYSLYEGGPWYNYPGFDLPFSVNLAIPGYEPPVPKTLATMGFHSIDPGEKREYMAGDSFALKLKTSDLDTNQPQRVDWYFDGQPVDTATVTLSSGNHVVRAVLSYSGYNAVEETLELELEVL